MPIWNAPTQLRQTHEEETDQCNADGMTAEEAIDRKLAYHNHLRAQCMGRTWEGVAPPYEIRASCRAISYAILSPMKRTSHILTPPLGRTPT